MTNNNMSSEFETKLKPFVTIKNLFKNFGKIKVFQNFNLQINEGERIALLGVNGSGKSTLIDILLGLKPKDKGQINYSHGFKDFLRGVQVAFQVGDYPNNMKVKHLVKFYCNFYAKTYSHKMVMRLVEILEIKAFWNQKANKLSFGQRKRLQALLMFIVDSDFFIIDELTAGVDINTRVKIIALFQKLFDVKPNKGMIWITHESSEIEKLCNRIVIFSKSSFQVVFDGSLADVQKKYQSVENLVAQHLREEVTEELKEFDVDINF